MIEPVLYRSGSTPPQHRHVAPAADRRSLSLLLIEDDRADAVLVEELIADSVADISGGVGAIDGARRGCPHPQAPGLRPVGPESARCHRVRWHRPYRRVGWHLPVVVLTGLNDEEFGVSAVASGAQDYLVKGRVEPDMLEISRSDRARLVMQAEALDAQAVELRRSNAELEQFAYVASHDLQEPLRKVASFCQLLEQRYGNALDERGIEYIGFAVDGAKRMQVLINDLLTFSRVGRLNVTHATVDLDTTLETALGNLAAAIEESGAQIARPDGPLPQVMGDATLMTMLWQNLIGNAVKFRREDRAPQVIIDCERGTGDHHGHWIFSVADNGIGIAPEFAEKVFVIFQRLHGRDAYTGTGIGLALCKKIVELHGGSIGIDTSDNSGTRFWFTLPITAASDETPIGAAEGAHR